MHISGTDLLNVLIMSKYLQGHANLKEDPKNTF